MSERSAKAKGRKEVQMWTVYLLATKSKIKLDILRRCGMIESERGNSLKTFLKVDVIHEKGASKEVNGAAETVPGLTDGKEV
jgi:hypothetical protein